MRKSIVGIAAIPLAAGLLVSVPFLGTSNATNNKKWVCHPNNGNGYVLIHVPYHSHFNQDGTPKHTNTEGQSDVLAGPDGCPTDEPTEEPTEEPTDDPTNDPTAVVLLP